MKERWFISDTHFGHEATCTRFTRNDGSPLRPFANSQEMDEEMIQRWNAVVQPHHSVYHLGDYVINKKFLNIGLRLNGKKRLIRGNHDIFKTALYLPVFDEIYGVRVFDDFICSHIPLHRDAVIERYETNVHGHLHERQVVYDNDFKAPDPRYLCVSVEQTNYRPLHYDEVLERIKRKRETYPHLVAPY